MDYSRSLSLNQFSAYLRCFNRIVEYILGHENVSLYEFQRLFNDRSLALFSNNGLDDFLLDFFSSADYCQLNRPSKTLLHYSIGVLICSKNTK